METGAQLRGQKLPLGTARRKPFPRRHSTDHAAAAACPARAAVPLDSPEDPGSLCRALGPPPTTNL
eukprot:5849020-Pyramimonas_sp.AAC.1